MPKKQLVHRSKSKEQTHEDFDVDLATVLGRMTMTEPVGRALTTRSHFCKGEVAAAGLQGPLVPNDEYRTLIMATSGTPHSKDAAASCVGTLT